MTSKIFDSLDALNEYLADKKSKNVQIIFKSYVVGETKSMGGKTTYTMVDRFLVLE